MNAQLVATGGRAQALSLCRLGRLDHFFEELFLGLGLVFEDLIVAVGLPFLGGSLGPPLRKLHVKAFVKLVGLYI